MRGALRVSVLLVTASARLQGIHETRRALVQPDVPFRPQTITRPSWFAEPFRVPQAVARRPKASSRGESSSATASPFADAAQRLNAATLPPGSGAPHEAVGLQNGTSADNATNETSGADSTNGSLAPPPPSAPSSAYRVTLTLPVSADLPFNGTALALQLAYLLRGREALNASRFDFERQATDGSPTATVAASIDFVSPPQPPPAPLPPPSQPPSQPPSPPSLHPSVPRRRREEDRSPSARAVVRARRPSVRTRRVYV